MVNQHPHWNHHHYSEASKVVAMISPQEMLHLDWTRPWFGLRIDSQDCESRKRINLEQYSGIIHYFQIGKHGIRKQNFQSTWLGSKHGICILSLQHSWNSILELAEMHYLHLIMSLYSHIALHLRLWNTPRYWSFNLFLRWLVIAILEVWLAGVPPALVPGSLIAHSRLILSCCSSLILMLIAQPYSCAQQRHKDSLSILISLPIFSLVDV